MTTKTDPAHTAPMAETSAVAAPRKRPGAPCTVGVILESVRNSDLDADNKKFIEDALEGANPNMHTPLLAVQTAQELGFDVSAAIVRRHRRRKDPNCTEKCKCPLPGEEDR